MKKIVSSALVSAALLFSATAAQADNWFAGLEAGMAKTAFEAKAKNISLKKAVTDNEVTNNTFGIRFGKYLNDNIRVYGTYSQNSSFKFKKEGTKELLNGKIEEQTLVASVDYVFMEGSEFRPFAGASLGANKMKVDTKLKPLNGNNTSAVFGAQAGVIYQAGSVDAELGLRYRIYGNEVKKSFTNGASSVDLALKHKNSAEAYLSVAYRF